MGTSTEAGSRSGDTAPRAFVVRPAEPKDAASFLEMWRAVIAERYSGESKSMANTRHSPLNAPA